MINNLIPHNPVIHSVNGTPTDEWSAVIGIRVPSWTPKIFDATRIGKNSFPPDTF